MHVCRNLERNSLKIIFKWFKLVYIVFPRLGNRSRTEFNFASLACLFLSIIDEDELSVVCIETNAYISVIDICCDWRSFTCQ